MDAMREVRETYRRVANVKSSGLAKGATRPDMAKQLSINRARRRAQVCEELRIHAANIRSMYRRIEELYTSDRKKTPGTSRGHPPLIRRTSTPQIPGTSLRPYPATSPRKSDERGGARWRDQSRGDEEEAGIPAGKFFDRTKRGDTMYRPRMQSAESAEERSGGGAAPSGRLQVKSAREDRSGAGGVWEEEEEEQRVEKSEQRRSRPRPKSAGHAARRANADEGFTRQGSGGQTSRSARGGRSFGTAKAAGSGEVREVGAGVHGSDVMVKQSSDPYSDFRASMMDMIVERRLYKEVQLEQLFQYYMDLNPPVHHQILREAIRDIREELRMPSPR